MCNNYVNDNDDDDDYDYVYKCLQYSVPQFLTAFRY
jgi:hypothetical protein